MVQFLLIFFFLGFLQFSLGFSKVPVFFVSPCTKANTSVTVIYGDANNVSCNKRKHADTAYCISVSILIRISLNFSHFENSFWIVPWLRRLVADLQQRKPSLESKTSQCRVRGGQSSIRTAFIYYCKQTIHSEEIIVKK